MPTDEIISTLAKAADSIAESIKASLKDHDLLIKIDSKLDNHINNCECRTVKYDEHIKESPEIRDTVKENKMKTDGLVKACWILFTIMSGIIIKMLIAK